VDVEPTEERGEQPDACTRRLEVLTGDLLQVDALGTLGHLRARDGAPQLEPRAARQLGEALFGEHSLDCAYR
jgi:hypothetical protein